MIDLRTLPPEVRDLCEAAIRIAQVWAEPVTADLSRRIDARNVVIQHAIRLLAAMEER